MAAACAFNDSSGKSDDVPKIESPLEMPFDRFQRQRQSDAPGCTFASDEMPDPQPRILFKLPPRLRHFFVIKKLKLAKCGLEKYGIRLEDN